MENIGNLLKQARKQKAMTQEDLSHAIGVSRQAISKWESNETKPDLENIYKLCEVLGLTIDDFKLPKRNKPVKWQQKYTWGLVGVLIGLILGIGISQGTQRPKEVISKDMFITQSAKVNSSHTLQYTATSSRNLSDMDIKCIYEIAGEKYELNASVDGYEISCNKRIAKGNKVDIYLEVEDTLLYMYVLEYNSVGQMYMHYPVE
ncbi:MAG: helix-turn-helix transcriptional regulator [Erysipelotrichales bacterium]|nr:helix-turn-helix transcriptional regulator [Erysipelotrichales bacterium]